MAHKQVPAEALINLRQRLDLLLSRCQECSILVKDLLHYNDKPHRTQSYSRMEDWRLFLPPSGISQMCSWERFCTFAREPQRRKVDASARVSVEGIAD
jgi:hypothetical protein